MKYDFYAEIPCKSVQVISKHFFVKIEQKIVKID